MKFFMTAVILNTLSFAKKLKDAGVPAKQAEVQAEVFAEFIREQNEQQATKIDLKELEYKLIIKFGTMLTIAVGILAAIIKF